MNEGSMNKEEAAQFIGVSVRALERYTKQGRVAVAYTRGKTRSVATYERNDLEALKSELERPDYRPATLKADETEGQGEGQHETPSDSDTHALARFGGVGAVPSEQTAQAAALLLALVQGVAQDVQPDTLRRHPETSAQEAHAKLLLTLPECSTLTGLSRATLKAAIDAGELPARQIGRAWRVKRTELERWIDSL